MTVLQVCAYAAPYEGNFIKSLRALATTLAAQGHRTAFALPESAKTIDWVKVLGREYDVFFLPLAKARIKPETYIALRNIYKKYNDLAVIHSHFELYDVPVSITAPKDVKVFWHLHDALQMYNTLKHRTIHKIQYGFLHGRVKLLSVSEKHMQYVLDCGFPKNQAEYVPNGIDTDRIKLVTRSPENRKYDFIMFGWEFERKGVDLCIETIQAKTLSYKVAVVGTTDTARIIQERYGAGNGIEVVEPVSDINELYNNTKCFLHISRAEGLSYALLEAVYAGLPVICSDISENQFAQRFPTVKMVTSESIKEIGRAMQDMMEQPLFANNIVALSRQIIEAEYSISSWVNQIMSEYGL